MIDVGGRDSVAIFIEQTRRKWRAGVHLNADWRRELAIRDMFVSGDLGVVDDRLSAFLNVEDDVNFRFVVNGLRLDFYIFISAIVIKRFEVLHTLLHELLAHAAMRPDV